MISGSIAPAWFLLGKEEPPSNPPRKVRGLLHLSLTYLVYFSPNFHHFFWSASTWGDPILPWQAITP
jgi:hypothetical protein